MANADFVTRITLQNQEFQNEIRRCQQEIRNLRNSANQSSVGISSMVGSLAKITGVSLGVGAVVGGIKELATASINAYRNIEMLRVSFSTLLGSSDKANQLVDSLRNYGANSPYDTEGLAKAAQLMLGYGMKAQQIMPTLEQLGDIAMGDSNKLQSLALAFSQMSAAGKVCKQDLNQMINAGFNPLQIISEQTGESIGDLFDKVSKGQISVRQIQQAFKDATSEGGKFYNMANNMSNTLDGQIASMADEWVTLEQSIGQLIAPAVIIGIKALTSAIQGLNNVMDGGKSKGASQFATDTKNALSYANNKAKRGKNAKEQTQIYNKTLDNAINFETKRLYNTNRQINALENRIKTHKYGQRISDGTDDNKFKDTQTLKELKWKRDNINVRIQNYNEAKTANPFIQTPSAITSPTKHTPSKGGGGSNEKVYLQNTLAWYENEIRKAEETAASAIGQEAYKAAMATVKALEEARDNFKDGWTGAKNEDVSKLKLGDSSNLTGTPNLSLPTLKDLKPLGDIIDQKQIDKINELAEAMEKARGVFESYGGDTVSLQKQIYDLADAYKLTGDSSSFAGAGMALMGQQMQALGKDGAVAKMGAVMAAIGQLILGYGEATAQAAKLGPWAWVAFAATGLATLITTISQIQSFSQGGILNGGSVAGDQMLARVNAGEMILNGSQQRKLFNMLDSNGAIGGFSGGQVEFKINGSTLKGVLRNYDNKMSIL